MGKKDTETTQTQETSIDPAVMAKWNALYGSAEGAASLPYTAYTGDTVAGLTSGQSSAYGMAEGNAAGSSGFNGFGMLQQLLGSDVGSLSDSDLSKYMNPYTDMVISNTLSDIDKQRVLSLQGVGDVALGGGAFGGDRQALLESETNRQYGDLAADTSAAMRESAFTNAQDSAQKDIDTQLQTMLQKAGIATSGISGQQTALAQLFGMGTTEQATEQSALDSAYSQWLEARDWDKTNTSFLSSILSGMPYGTSTTGTTTQSGGSPLSGVLGTLLGAGNLLFGGGTGSALSSVLGGGSGAAPLSGNALVNNYGLTR